MATLSAFEQSIDQKHDRPVSTPLAKRVCHVSLTLCTGGLERLLVDFAGRHDRQRYIPEFVAFGDLGQPAADIRSRGCHVTHFPLSHLGRGERVRRLAGLFRDRKVDVVHTHNAQPHLWATLAARLAGVPVVIHTRHGRRFGKGVWEGFQFGLASRLADRVVAVSDDTAALCRHVGCLTPRTVDRIWNGIDVNRFAYSGPNPNRKTIAMCRVSAEKDFDTLLKAVSIVVSEVPDFHLMLVGDGPERGALETLSHDLGLQDSVTFLGERSDVPELLASAAVFVCSSRTEGISLTLLEAMAVGLPVIATKVGGNPEVVASEATGQLVPASNPTQLATAIIDLCLSPDRCQQWGAAGRKRVEDCFSVDRMVRDYERLYDEIAAAKPRRKGH